MIGSLHIEFGAPYECLQVPILKDMAHIEGIPDPEPGTIFLTSEKQTKTQRKIERHKKRLKFT